MANKITKLMLNGEEYEIREYQAGWQPGANTILYMPLTSQTTVYDQSSNQNDGTVNGTVNFGTNLGVDCGAFLNSGYISIPHSASMETSIITISCWAAIATGYNTNNGGIVNYGKLDNAHGPVSLSNVDNATLQINGNSCAIGGTGFTGNNQWSHLVGIYDGNMVYLYVNNVLVNSRSYNGSILTNSDNINIGAYYSPQYKMNGYLSNVIVEDKARTEQEISDYYDQTKSLYGIS